jgi:hypothetical protein
MGPPSLCVVRRWPKHRYAVHTCTTKLMQVHQSNKTVAHKCYDADHIAKWNVVNWYLQETHAREINPTLIVYRQSLANLSGDMITQNNRQWYA